MSACRGRVSCHPPRLVGADASGLSIEKVTFRIYPSQSLPSEKNKALNSGRQATYCVPNTLDGNWRKLDMRFEGTASTATQRTRLEATLTSMLRKRRKFLEPPLGTLILGDHHARSTQVAPPRRGSKGRPIPARLGVGRRPGVSRGLSRQAPERNEAKSTSLRSFSRTNARLFTKSRERSFCGDTTRLRTAFPSIYSCASWCVGSSAFNGLRSQLCYNSSATCRAACSTAFVAPFRVTLGKP